jgi:hypothetical protein
VLIWLDATPLQSRLDLFGAGEVSEQVLALHPPDMVDDLVIADRPLA